MRPSGVINKKDFMQTEGVTGQLSENLPLINDITLTRKILEKFERAKILEIYFARLDGRTPENIPSDHHELFEIELSAIKAFLLGQYPQDTLLQRIFRFMN